MRTITIIGWSAKASAIVERVTFWPDEMKLYVAIAKASNITDLMTIQDVLVEGEEEENETQPS